MALSWLYQHLASVTSQHGEDGVIQAIFDKIGVANAWCVDLGAGDGYFISNTWDWVHNKKRPAVLIEAADEWFSALKEVYGGRADVHCLQEFVTPDNHMDAVLARTPVPENFDLLSLDIDGMDFKVWEKMTVYRPRVVVIEVNCSMDKDIFFVQEKPDERMGSSLLAMTNLAKTKGYELVAHLISNAIFVDKGEYDKLGITDNSVESLFFSPFVPKIVSDLNGIHYILKEGPWGFSGAIHANDLRPRESGDPAARRLRAEATPSNGQIVALHMSGAYGFKAFQTQDPALFKMLDFFIANNAKAAQARK